MPWAGPRAPCCEQEVTWGQCRVNGMDMRRHNYHLCSWWETGSPGWDSTETGSCADSVLACLVTLNEPQKTLAFAFPSILTLAQFCPSPTLEAYQGSVQCSFRAPSYAHQPHPLPLLDVSCATKDLKELPVLPGPLGLSSSAQPSVDKFSLPWGC